MVNQESNTDERKKLPDYLHNMQFKEVPIEKDYLYSKVVYRMAHDKPVVKGVSIVWKYVSVAAMFALLIISSYLILSEKETETTQLPVTYVEIATAVMYFLQIISKRSSFH